MNLKPFFRYYGGKWLAAPHYPKPEHGSIIEPFAGSAGYSVRYSECGVLLYDIDPILFGVWDYLIKVSIDDLKRLPAIVENTDDLPNHVPQEARYLIGFWLNPASATPKKRMSIWNRGDRKQIAKERAELYWSERVIDRLVLQVPYIRHWKVFNRSYETAANVRATWFIDPPYSVATQYYRFKMTSTQFLELAGWVRTRHGQVIVCERGWADWLPFTRFRDSRSTKYQFSPESVYIQSDGVRISQ